MSQATIVLECERQSERRGVWGRCCVREADREDVIERESQLEDATLAVLDTIQASAKARSETAEGVPPATNGSHA